MEGVGYLVMRRVFGDGGTTVCIRGGRHVHSVHTWGVDMSTVCIHGG